ncbi:MAG: PDZ domain-containing protein [Mariniblastus sp.]
MNKNFIHCFAVIAIANLVVATTWFDCKTASAFQREDTKPYVGIFMEEKDVIKITSVVDGSPAERAAIRIDDILTHVNGNKVHSIEQARKKIYEYYPGDEITIRFLRDGKPIDLKLVLAETEIDAAGTAPSVPAKPLHTPVTFRSLDRIVVTGDMYFRNESDKETPFVLLCHHSGESRGAFRKIGLKLASEGFNCLAIDHRSGGTVSGISNQTMQKAVANGKPTTPVDSEQDILAAIKWVRSNHAKGKLLVWGNGSSGSLAIRIAGEGLAELDGVLAFTPNEYFAEHGKPADWIAASAKNVKIPVYVSACRDGAEKSKAITQSVPENLLTSSTGSVFQISPRAYFSSVSKFLSRFK